MDRPELLKKKYNLQKHKEGGFYCRVFTSPLFHNNRPITGSIFFLLDKKDISHFHQTDCDEIWHYHEGCGLKITIINEKGEISTYLLGTDVENNQRAMVIVPKGSIFGAENLDTNDFTFLSCITAPQFIFDKFKLYDKEELKNLFPHISEDILHLCI